MPSETALTEKGGICIKVHSEISDNALNSHVPAKREKREFRLGIRENLVCYYNNGNKTAVFASPWQLHMMWYNAFRALHFRWGLFRREGVICAHLARVFSIPLSFLDINGSVWQCPGRGRKTVSAYVTNSGLGEIAS